MSKGPSELYKRTAGANADLVDQLVASGVKCFPENIVGITKDPITGKIVWMETGNSKAGLAHIIGEHGHEFNGKGISNDEIPNYVLEAVSQGKIVGYQGKKNGRAIYEFTYEGKVQRVAVSVGSNGFIVGANPKSMEGW